MRKYYFGSPKRIILICLAVLALSASSGWAAESGIPVLSWPIKDKSGVHRADVRMVSLDGFGKQAICVIAQGASNDPRSDSIALDCQWYGLGG